MTQEQHEEPMTEATFAETYQQLNEAEVAASVCVHNSNDGERITNKI